jgi:hypothetical protein
MGDAVAIDNVVELLRCSTACRIPLAPVDGRRRGCGWCCKPWRYFSGSAVVSALRPARQAASISSNTALDMSKKVGLWAVKKPARRKASISSVSNQMVPRKPSCGGGWPPGSD